MRKSKRVSRKRLAKKSVVKETKYNPKLNITKSLLVKVGYNPHPKANNMLQEHIFDIAKELKLGFNENTVNYDQYDNLSDQIVDALLKYKFNYYT